MNHTPAPEDTTNPRHAVLIGEDGAMTSLTLPAEDSARLAEATALVVAGSADTDTADAEDDTARHHGGEPR